MSHVSDIFNNDSRALFGISPLRKSTMTLELASRQEPRSPWLPQELEISFASTLRILRKLFGVCERVEEGEEEKEREREREREREGKG